MIEYNSIDLFGHRVFTCFKTRTPVNEKLKLPSTACFTYIIDGDNQSLSKELKIDAKPGHVIASSCGISSRMKLSKSNPEEGMISVAVVHFEKTVLQRIYKSTKPSNWRELEKPLVNYIVQDSASELVKHYFYGIPHLFTNIEAISEEILILKLKEIIELLLKTNQSPEITQIIRSLFSDRTFNFKSTIEAHLYEPFSINNLSSLTFHSLTSFKNEFKKVFNDTPERYIVKRRVEKSADLLKYSDETISKIGYDCGFKSPAHFSRVFKQSYNVSPTNYRSEFNLKSQLK